jgi:hypothetical protein
LEARQVAGVRAERIALELAIGDTSVNIRVSTLDERHRWFAASFDEAILVYRDAGDHLLVRLPPGEDISATGIDIHTDLAEPPLKRAVLDFESAVRSDDCDTTSIGLGLQTVRLIDWFEQHKKLYAGG